jgi:hypothetical protein
MRGLPFDASAKDVVSRIFFLFVKDERENTDLNKT